MRFCERLNENSLLSPEGTTSPICSKGHRISLLSSRPAQYILSMQEASLANELGDSFESFPNLPAAACTPSANLLLSKVFKLTKLNARGHDTAEKGGLNSIQ